MAETLIVGLGGTAKPNSSSERALRHVMRQCADMGAETLLLDGPALDLPMYVPGSSSRTERAAALVDALRRADGIVIASPGYHGTLSGLVKNALDYVEDMARDERPYFEGRAVGLIAVAAGWQATGTTLGTLRSVTHALRGWPTPLGVAINSVQPIFGDDGDVVDAGVRGQLNLLAQQVLTFARMRALHDLASASAGMAQE